MLRPCRVRCRVKSANATLPTIPIVSASLARLRHYRYAARGPLSSCIFRGIIVAYALYPRIQQSSRDSFAVVPVNDGDHSVSIALFRMTRLSGGHTLTNGYQIGQIEIVKVIEAEYSASKRANERTSVRVEQVRNHRSNRTRALNESGDLSRRDSTLLIL